ncbi:MAG TPA: hypothetical protein VIV12_12990 [Streptosporangiaceae bacterium]
MTDIAILCNGSETWASSRLRGYWLQAAAPLVFRAYGPGDSVSHVPEETVVFQKRFKAPDLERAARYKAEGRRVIFDLTDPMWWWFPAEVEAMFRLADAVTTSNPGLTEAVRQSGKAARVLTIPDRMLGSFHPTPVQHGPRERAVLVWYGDGGNRIALDGYLPLLGYLAHFRPLELRLIDQIPGVKVVEEDSPHLRITHIPWALETFHAQLLAADIAYTPPYPGPWGLLKSNNREVTAWWAGLPTASGLDLGELVELLDHPDLRAQIGAENRQRAEQHWDIQQSVADWQALAKALKDGLPVPAPDGHADKEAADAPV